MELDWQTPLNEKGHVLSGINPGLKLPNNGVKNAHFFLDRLEGIQGPCSVVRIFDFLQMIGIHILNHFVDCALNALLGFFIGCVHCFHILAEKTDLGHCLTLLVSVLFIHVGYLILDSL